jgi:3-hydroxybutyryl-CoA dehydratase
MTLIARATVLNTPDIAPNTFNTAPNLANQSHDTQHAARNTQRETNVTDATIRSDFQVGERASLTRTIAETDVMVFARLVGDLNPIHLDAGYAGRTRFGRRLAHDTFSGSLISTVLGNELPGPGSVCLSQQLEFLAPVYLGDTITATVQVIAWQPERRLVTLKTDVHNQDGRQVITGRAVLLVDRPVE